MRTRCAQLSLDLRSAPRWGGRRPGAGRKPGSVRRDPHRRRLALSAHHPCHVTVRVRSDLPSLRSVRLVREVEASFRRARERGRFRLVQYSIQSNHVHMIVEAAGAADLACGMKSLGSRLARAVNRVLGRRRRVLADRFHLHVLRTPREVRNALAYVLLNARRHAAKLGQRLSKTRGVDPASSGRWFEGWRSPPAQRAASDLPAVAAARTWLLRVGWRRRGLIDPSEVPGIAGGRRWASHPFAG